MQANASQELLEQAARESADVWLQAVRLAREVLRGDGGATTAGWTPENWTAARKLLDSHGVRMAQHLPQLMRAVFRRLSELPVGLKTVASQGLKLEALELMDEAQVRERVELARAQDLMVSELEAAYLEFLPLFCALLGLDRVVPERNPLRVQAYVEAIQQSMVDFALPVGVRAIWWRVLAQPLGQQLAQAYTVWTLQLRQQGVRPVEFGGARASRAESPAAGLAASAEPGAQGGTRGQRPVWTPQYRRTFLTLQKLREFMVGATVPAESSRDVFARQFAQQFESGLQPSGGEPSFAATVPAALDALDDVQHLDAVVQRMKQAAPVEQGTMRERFRAMAANPQQLLGLEVLTLMLDKLTADERLPKPLRDAIAALESPFAQLVMVDSRFFSNRQHPARRLLDELAEQGMAFASEQDAGFADFMRDLQDCLADLLKTQVHDAEPFAQALATWTLMRQDRQSTHAYTQHMAGAVQALSQAEQRNFLADELAQQLRELPALRRVPPEISSFLLGAWCQVMATAQLEAKDAADDDCGGYKQLVNDLLWSAQPDLTRRDIGKLTKMVARLLAKLREGLQHIDYPSAKTGAFFEALMKCHQMAFGPVVEAPPAQDLAPSLLGEQSHWVAPHEAKASGFMSLDEDAPAASPPGLYAKTLDTSRSNRQHVPLVGTWFEIRMDDGAWRRTQLTWVSPQGSMLLFTSGQGLPQSMPQLVFDRLMNQGRLRTLAAQKAVDDALQSVVETALHNTLQGRV
ncbi:MAG: hypothetical protein Fur007_13970 [Rhodoferax sp.]